MPDATVFWTRPAQTQLQAVYVFISRDSLQNASTVLNDLVGTVERAASNPMMHPPDKFKVNNDGSYRAFEKHHYRVSFRYVDNEIRVLRVRHTSMLPHKY